ncbi:OmpA family protein [Aquimarina sp. 2201CG14-23]|uniref:OmpA family protein n=1 Tax=Aquimarina mycalae TaxID=3040073 RepID=UPI002477FA5E|nr:OmpA family protein [Aquimarina sp. 2201CG14-23]MDH7447662.1 OmpA family protein [Aquimarina sp. 2201CG14-23]
MTNYSISFLSYVKRHYSIHLCISVVLSLLLLNQSFGQDKNKQLTKADQSFEALAYINARDIYLNVAEQGYSSPDLYRKLADSYYFTGELEESVQWYEKLITNFSEGIKPEYLFRYAQSLKSVERYKDSDAIMERFNMLTGNDKRAKSFVNKRDYLHFIEMQSGKYDLYTLGINSEYSDYAPSFDHKGQIVFASSRGKRSKIHEWNQMPFLDLFSSVIGKDEVSAAEPVKLKGKINTKFHESSTSFTKDGKTVYFTRNNFTNNKLGKSRKGVVLLKLYKATFVNGKWSNITELPFNSDNYSISHPALSPDGKQLYFASDMKGTRGRSDLFVVDVLPGGKYGKPKNLGDDINTEGRETFPYISDSGRLYFASDGHVGLGGLDVFVAISIDDGVSEVFNVGKPINSSKDDFSFVLNEENKTGYFASNRKGGKGNDDIYSFRQTEELITTCKEYLTGIITDSETKEPLADVDVSLIDNDGNILSTIKSAVNGGYSFEVDCDEQYIIRASIDGFNPNDIIFRSKDTYETTNNVPIEFVKEKLLSTTSEPVNIGDDIVDPLQLNTIFFDLDNDEIRVDAEADLQKVIAVMKQNPKLKIEVRSHTDSRSSYWYNKKLSVKRMRATVRYIIRNGGINWRRIRGKAYGERRLINDCGNGVPCTEEQHQENRRSEFIVRK